MYRILSRLKLRRSNAAVAILLAALAIGVDARASGWPPFTQRDNAVVTRGGGVSELTNGTKSVLDNDFDLERDPLTAVLIDDVDHGILELREDGTFSYEHNGGPSNRDTFVYRAFDGTGYSRPTQVRIDIEDAPNTPPFVVAEVPDQQAIEGMAFRLELADNFADADAGDVLRFRARDLPDSGSLRIDATSGVLSGTPVGSDVRTDPYDIEIVATDRAGASASLMFELLIFRDNRADVALAVSLAANPVSVGETMRWNIQIENRGPGVLQEGQLSAAWTTSGPALTLNPLEFCTVTSNGTSKPGMDCLVGPLDARATLEIVVEGIQDGDGDNSLIGVISADDPVLDNNSDLASAQVVAELSEGPTQMISVSSAGVDSGDLNGDGEVDIVATAEETLIFLNDGERAVTTPGISLGSDSGGSVVRIVDWNGDGSADIAVGGLAGRTAQVYVNDGSGSFESAEVLDVGDFGAVNDMIAADLDSDGASELVLTGSSSTLIARRLSQGGIEVTSLSSGAGLDLAVADIDQDGDRDIVVVRASDRAVDVHYNDGVGASFSRTRINHGSVATVTAADLNGDGATDLMLGVDGNDLNVPENKVLYQESGGGFAPGGSFGASPITELIAGDVNIDGWTDVVAVNRSGVHQLYIGSSGSGFALSREQIVSVGMQRGVLTDFNGDDSPDLIIVGRDSGFLEIYANDGIGSLGLGDRTAPILELLGEVSINIPAGQEYLDPGATAVDNVDGDISDRIQVSGTIDSTTVGTQTITYSVADRAGNTVSAVRTVVVGVNQGAGGGGGGVVSPVLIITAGILLAVLRVWRGRRRRTRYG